MQQPNPRFTVLVEVDGRNFSATESSLEDALYVVTNKLTTAATASQREHVRLHDAGQQLRSHRIRG